MTETALLDELCLRVAAMTGDVRELIETEVRRVAPLATPTDQHRLAADALARLDGLGELEVWLADPAVDEVLVNAGTDIWIDRGGRLTRVGELTAQPLEHLIERILGPIGRRVDRTSPIVDARLPDGSRVCAVVGPVGVDGPSVSIRRFATDVRPLAEFTDPVGVNLCREVIDARCNVVVTGATSSGKTSLLAAMISALPAGERVVVLEDTAELPISDQHVVRFEARPPSLDGPGAITLDDLVRTALRFRPDRLIVGEIRGTEVLGLVQALNTGHDGSFSTCHANGPLDALLRLESLVLQAAPTWPLAAIRHQLARSIDVIIHVARSRPDGGRRIESITEVAAEPDADGGERVSVLADIAPHGSLTRHARLRRRR
ncbi:MAG: CpaF family protein [Ilumatobacter sp.]|nr:CpaF family protein [Ilumatobacter sp.]